MKKLAFIPTREQKNYPITSYLEGAGFEVHLLVNKKSIFAAYTEALEEFSAVFDIIRHALNPLRGCVFHGDSILDLHPTFYGSFGPVVVMDGLFLAAKGRTLLTIGLSQPDYLPGPWDFYDILYNSIYSKL